MKSRSIARMRNVRSWKKIWKKKRLRKRAIMINEAFKIYNIILQDRLKKDVTNLLPDLQAGFKKKQKNDIQSVYPGEKNEKTNRAVCFRPPPGVWSYR